MRQSLDITADGDIISDDGEIHTLIDYDPEAVEDPFD